MRLCLRLFPVAGGLAFFALLGVAVASPDYLRTQAATSVRAQAQTTTQDQSAAVQVGTSYHHDVSPALREMVQTWPAAQGREGDVTSLSPRVSSNPTEAPNPVIQGGFWHRLVASSIPSPILNFDGMPFGVGGGGVPPNTHGAVGLSQYVQTVNGAYQVFDKATGASVLGPTAISAIWGGFGGVCQTAGQGDPVVLYDHVANRWLVSQFAGAAPTDACIAISTTSDATGAYNRYAFHLGANFFDSPHLGIWPDGYYMSLHVFNSSGTVFLGPQAFAFDRAKMLAGVPATSLTLGVTGGASEPSFSPSDLDGVLAPPAGAGNPFVSYPGSGIYKVRLFHADFVTPANTTFVLISSPAAAAFTALCPGTRSCVPQPNTTVQLDGLGGRFMVRLAYRKFSDHESVVGNYAVSANGVAGIRWFELRNVTDGPVTVYQESTYQPDTTWRWTGSAAMDRIGNLALGFSASSSTVFPSIRYAGRLASDPVNTLPQGEATLVAGLGSQTSSSGWGNSSSMTVDPVDDCTFWYTNEYIGAPLANWRTRIGNFRFGECTTGPTPTPTPTPTATPIATATPSATATPAATPTATATPIVTPTPAATPTPSSTPSPAPAQALNISTRLRVETGDKVTIAGFIIAGTQAKTVAIRGIGPSLANSGLSDVLADPTLELRDASGALIWQNDNWQDDPAAAGQLTALGLALQDPRESGIAATLEPGAYTAIMAGKNQTSGIGLVEVYDVNPAAASQLANLSTRGFVQTGDKVMIGGFILGHSGANANVIVRGLGPSLSQIGLSNVLADPTLELRDSNGTLLIANDNWQSDPVSAAQLIAHGLAPSSPAESGIFASLPPGLFTAILAGKNGGVGVGLIEVYDVSSNPTPAATPSPTPAPMPCPFPPTAFGQDFDGVIPPILPADWTAANAKGPPPLWVTSNAGNPSPAADSSPNAAFVDDPDLISDKRLDSPNIENLFGTNARLTFRHNFNLQNGFDGAVLEISIFGGAFQDVVEAGGSFVSGGYNSTISTGFGSPIAGRQAWSGNSAGFITTVVNLPHYTDYSNFQLRWRIGTDTSVSGEGWRIDTLSIKICPKPIPQTPTPTPPEGTPTPTTTPTTTATAAPTITPTPTPARLTVTSTADSGVGSLRATIAAANDGDTIQFAPTLSGPIGLTSAELIIDKSITINGPGSGLLTVSRSSGTLRIFHVLPGHSVAISNLEIANGSLAVTDTGGGIRNDQSMLTLNHCSVVNNFGGQFGGGIYNDGGKARLTIINCTIDGNRAGVTGGASGGGIYNNDGTLEIRESSVSGNFATTFCGGIYNSASGTLSIRDSAINWNSVTVDFMSNPPMVGSLGGIYNDGTAEIARSTINQNTGGGGSGGIGSSGSLTISDSTIDHNTVLSGAGGIGNTGLMTITNSTISNNSASFKQLGHGGGITNGGTLTISNSTLSGNHADTIGGVDSTGPLTLINSTLSGNYSYPGGIDGGGNIRSVNGTLQIGNTILNSDSADAIFGSSTSIVSLGYNLCSDNGGDFLNGIGDQINTNPVLGPLQNNGGPTFTHALLTGSPAINAGNPGFTPPPFYDQRGPGYDRVVGGRIDIGSFEAQP